MEAGLILLVLVAPLPFGSVVPDSHTRPAGRRRKGTSRRNRARQAGGNGYLSRIGLENGAIIWAGTLGGVFSPWP